MVISALLDHSPESLRISARSSGTWSVEVSKVHTRKSEGFRTQAYLTHTLIALNQTMHSFDSQERFIHAPCCIAHLWLVLVRGVEDVWCDDSSQVVDVHLAARFLINVAEGADPVHESEKNLERIAMCFGQEAAGKMQKSSPSICLFNSL